VSSKATCQVTPRRERTSKRRWRLRLRRLRRMSQTRSKTMKKRGKLRSKRTKKQLRLRKKKKSMATKSQRRKVRRRWRKRPRMELRVASNRLSELIHHLQFIEQEHTHTCCVFSIFISCIYWRLCEGSLPAIIY